MEQLEGSSKLRHPSPVSLHFLRYRIGVWFQCPTGRLAAVLLALAMITPAPGGLKLHAHTDGDHHHHHVTHVDSDMASDALDESGNDGPFDGARFHGHDHGNTVSALSEPPALFLAPLLPVAPVAQAVDPAPPSSARTPPHRPPIA